MISFKEKDKVRVIQEDLFEKALFLKEGTVAWVDKDNKVTVRFETSPKDFGCVKYAEFDAKALDLVT